MQQPYLQRSNHKKVSRWIMEFCFRAGFFDKMQTLWPDRLTVLAYHRIADPDASGFDTFKSNVSATPAAFAAQMDFIKLRFNVIGIDELLAWLHGRHSLPPNPLLITFDDGYRDNFEHALPILQQRRLPAVIFLATNYIGQACPFYWDFMAYCFYHTSQNGANLPLLGCQEWVDQKGRAMVMSRWLSLLKKLPDAEKWAVVGQLPCALNVSVPADAFAGLYLTWDQVRTLVSAGVAMGAHTQSHPILTSISLEQARTEVTGSKLRIEAEIGRPVKAFAYPNGLAPDFNTALQTMLGQAGFETAFTLIPGPFGLAKSRQTPMTIRRVMVHHKDTLSHFAANLIGRLRLLELSR